MHLIEKYSLNCGVNPEKLEKPFIYTSYYPIQFEKYIVIHPSSGMNAKNYSYYQDIIDFIYDDATLSGYGFVQIGSAEDQPLSKCLNLQGKTNLHQVAYILKNCSLLIGNDSFSTHMASSFGIPLISLYSVIQPEVAGPYWKNGKQLTIMAPLDGKKPKYSTEDPDKIVNKINPEDIIEKINYLLPDIEFKKYKKIESIFFGTAYPKITIDFVPDVLNEINLDINLPINIRFDLLKSNNISEYNIDSCVINLLKRKSTITTSKPFDIKKLLDPHIKNNILSLIFIIENKKSIDLDNIIDFIINTKKNGIVIQLAAIKNDFSDNEINDLKFKFLNIQPVNVINRTSLLENIGEHRLSKINESTCFKSSRLVFSNNMIYPTKASYIENKPAESFIQKFSDIDDKNSIGEELESLYVFNLL